jgi:hypothetical protein
MTYAVNTWHMGRTGKKTKEKMKNRSNIRNIMLKDTKKTSTIVWRLTSLTTNALKFSLRFF